MHKKTLLAASCALMSLPSLAQIELHDTGAKWDGEIAQLVENGAARRAANGLGAAAKADSVLNVTISVKDADAVAASITGDGHEATVITSDLVTAIVPVSYIPTLAAREDVLYVNAPTQFHPLLSLARNEIKATSVHQGTLLDTPFTGKGVVVGVIDQVFEYNHIAFKDRVKALWRNNKLTTTIPTSGGSSGSGMGHGTHVTNIAAGSKISDNNLYGIAYEADIVMAPSDFSSSVVLAQAKAIKQFAEDQGKPWVINMSFGGHAGPHDASTAYDQGLSALSGEGGIFVGAMGNEGGQLIHAEADFTESENTKYFYPKPGTDNTSGVIAVQVWGQATDGATHFTMRPVLVRRVGSTVAKEYPTDTQLSRAGFSYVNSVSPYNNKQYVTLFGATTNLTSVMGLGSSYVLMIEVAGDAGQTAHAWINNISYAQEFSTMAGIETVTGDDNYLCGEGGGSPAKSIAVGSYNSNPNFTSAVDNRTYSYQSAIGVKGQMSKFTSPGPQLGDAVKPTVSAPGGCIQSAFAKTGTGFSKTELTITSVVTGEDGKEYYYGVMSGTSMASPMVTGVVALWLEANPTLTYEDIVDIIKTTARRDSYTGTATTWDARSGYGKIDAYNGIKEALKRKTPSGIGKLNTSAPVTLWKGLDAWRVLFNNDESYADITLHNAAGQLVSARHIDAPKTGQEETISLSGLAPGVYVLNIGTTASRLTRKLVVK